MRHYLKVSETTRDWATKLLPDRRDWQRAIFEDLTEGGTCLIYIPLHANLGVPRLGLCGDVFFCEACPDRHRNDTLFVFRVEPADRRLPEHRPRRFQAQFELLDGSARIAEPLEDLLQEATRYAKQLKLYGWDPEPSRRPSAPAEPHPLLQRLLIAVPEPAARNWRPDAATDATADPQVLLESLQAVWSRFFLSRYAETSGVPERSLAILRGELRPQTLEAAQLQTLLGLFDVTLLNAFAVAHVRHETNTIDLLQAIAELPLEESVRASLWTARAAGLPPEALRRELQAVADRLVAASHDPQRRRIWEPPLLSVLRKVADSRHDGSLSEAVEFAREQGNPLEFVAEWAAKVQLHPPVRETPPLEPEPAAEAPLLTGEASPGPPAEAMPESVAAPASAATASEEASPTPDADEAADPSTPRPAPANGAVERWILALWFGDGDQLPCLVREVYAALESVLDACDATPGDVGRMQELRSRLEGMQAHIPGWLRTIPGPETVEQMRQECRTAYARARTALGDAADGMLDRSVQPLDLCEALDLLAHEPLLSALPGWFWAEAPDDMPPADAPARVRRLLSPGLRKRVTRVLADAGTPGFEDLELLAALHPPPPGVSADAHVGGFLRSLTDSRRLLTQLPTFHRDWIQAAQERGAGAMELLELAEQLEALQGRVTDEVLLGIGMRLVAPEAGTTRRALLDSFSAAVTTCEETFGASATHVSLRLLEALLQKQRSDPRRLPAAVPELRLEHNWVGEKRAKAPLVFAPSSSPSKPYGFVSAPLVLETNSRRELHLRLDLEMKTRQREGWPADWDTHSPRELFVSPYDWREHETRGTYVHSFAFVLPIRKPKRGRIEFTLTAFDLQRGAPAGEPKNFAWDDVQTDLGEVSLEWPDVVDPEYVRSHPIGPQHELDSVLQRIHGGSSFAVIAPRRFGKSTLVDYLATRLPDDLELAVPPPILCTQHASGGQIDYPALWQTVSEHLRGLTDASLPRVVDALPGPAAFDSVRRQVRQRGRRAILLLFDEAQLLFPRDGGHDIGDRLKDLLERHWMRSGPDRLPPVVFGLIGLPSLVDRAGANLVGLLRPIVKNDILEKDLELLIREVTRARVHLTREARVRLAGTAGNLFNLRTLLERLGQRIRAEHRNWANHDDVAHVEEQLKRELRAGHEAVSSVGVYLRDALNFADSVNEWKPHPSYPVALGLARARQDAATGTGALMARAGRILNDWCQSSSGDPLTRLVYTPERVEEHVCTLRDLGIFEDDSFRSSLFESWLVGKVANGYPSDEASREALYRGAMRRIRIPVLDPAPHAAGAEASVFTFSEGGQRWALRRVALQSDTDRDRFLESVLTLEKLKELYRKEPGSEYVFELREVGLADEDQAVGVQIYRWIEGIDLGICLGKLPAGLVVDLGWRLAMALRMLHRHAILHRDLRPRNVVLADDAARPVLIDFGLARLAGSELHTQVGGDHAAPEVRQPQPHWSRAADVYSLGSTLRSLLTPTETPPAGLTRLLERCCRADRAERPTAEEAHEELTHLAQLMHVADRGHKVWEAIRQRAGEDLQKPFFRQVLTKFEDRAKLLALGLHQEPLERLVEVAGLLDQLLEAYPAPGGTSLKLSVVKQRNEVTQDRLCCDEVELLHQLRLHRSHWTSAPHRKRVQDRLASRGPEAMQSDVLSGARRIGEVLGLQSLPNVVGALLGQP